MLDAALEGLVSHLTSADGGADLERAREAFHARTGRVEPGEPLYESHIQLFFDRYLCEWRSDDGSRPPQRYLASGAGGELEREVARACLTSARSLYRVLEAGDRAGDRAGDPASNPASNPVRLGDALGGGRFRISAEGSAARLRPGDVLDGRLLVVSGVIRLAPGIIFHPPETHAPLEELLSHVDLDAVGDRRDVLDGLVRMRLRLDRFTSIRARHIYRIEALEEQEILSAGWARRPADSTT